MSSRKLNEIRYIMLHCTASDSKAHDNLKTIDDWHKSKGWDEIGYNYLITKDGEQHYGRSLFKVGAHAKGEWNRNCISICLTGLTKFSIAQEHSLFNLIMHIMDDYKIEKVMYHREVNPNKTCPVFSWSWIARINEAIQAEEI